MIYYKRNLPHYQPEGYSFFITSRLAGTLPKSVYNRIKYEYEMNLITLSAYRDQKIKKEKYSEIRYRKFISYENILDSCKYSYKWLSEERIAKVVKDAIFYYENKRYELIAFTIMPNHIHLVIFPIVERKSSLARRIDLKPVSAEDQSESGDSLYIVTKIMQDLKKFTAREANKILKRSGKFWQNESYDHVIRDKEELNRIVKYVMKNPVKGGLCKIPENWKWSYYNPKYLI